jgi:hypothetical protein
MTMKESKALLEVRAWKDACWREVAHLPLDQAIAKRLRDATKNARKMGFYESVDGNRQIPHVAEPGAPYHVKEQGRKAAVNCRSPKDGMFRLGGRRSERRRSGIPHFFQGGKILE